MQKVTEFVLNLLYSWSHGWDWSAVWLCAINCLLCWWLCILLVVDSSYTDFLTKCFITKILVMWNWRCFSLLNTRITLRERKILRTSWFSSSPKYQKCVTKRNTTNKNCFISATLINVAAVKTDPLLYFFVHYGKWAVLFCHCLFTYDAQLGEKRPLCHIWTVMVKMSVHICAVWSGYSLFFLSYATVSIDSVSRQRRPCSAYANAQADQGPHCPQIA